MHPEMERLEKCLAAVRSFTDFVPETALVLGSGLGGFADALADKDQKQLMWRRLKQLPPLGEPY